MLLLLLSCGIVTHTVTLSALKWDNSFVRRFQDEHFRAGTLIKSSVLWLKVALVHAVRRKHIAEGLLLSTPLLAHSQARLVPLELQVVDAEERVRFGEILGRATLEALQRTRSHAGNVGHVGAACHPIAAPVYDKYVRTILEERYGTPDQGTLPPTERTMTSSSWSCKDPFDGREHRWNSGKRRFGGRRRYRARIW